MDSLEQFICSLETEKAGHRRSALINNMYYHIFTNDLVQYIGKQNIAKQLKAFEQQGEDVLFWKAMLVNIKIVTEKMKKLKDTIDDLCFTIGNCNHKDEFYGALWTKFCLMASFPQIFLCYPNVFKRTFFIDEMWRNGDKILMYTGNNVNDLMKLMNPSSLNTESKSFELAPPTPDHVDDNSIITLANAYEPQANEYKLRHPESDLLDDNENSSDEWKSAKEIVKEEKEQTLSELWVEYLKDMTPQRFLQLFSGDFSNPDYIHLNLLRSEIERYLVCDQREEKYMTRVKEWRQVFDNYGPELINLHKRICKVFLTNPTNKIQRKWSVYLDTTSGCYGLLFDTFFSNLDNMYHMWNAKDEDVEQILDQLDSINYKSPIVTLFEEYVCSPSHTAIFEIDYSSSSDSSSFSDDELPKPPMKPRRLFVEESSSSDSSSSDTDSTDSSSISSSSNTELVSSLSEDTTLDSYSSSYDSEYEYSESDEELPSYEQIVHDFEFVQILIEDGFPIDRKDEYGETLLMNAVRWRQDSAVIYLCDKGANLNLRNRAGKTVLHMTCGKLHKDTWSYVPFLLEHGADPEIRSYTGKTPMMYAIQNRATSTIKALKDYCGFPWFLHRRLVNRLPLYLQKILMA